MVELRYRQVFCLPPFGAAVVRVPHSTVVSHEYYLRVRRIYPHVVRVSVCTLKTTDLGKAFSAVVAHNQCAVRLKQAVWIFGIDDEIREVERTPDHPRAFVAFLACPAAIVGNK